MIYKTTQNLVPITSNEVVSYIGKLLIQNECICYSFCNKGNTNIYQTLIITNKRILCGNFIMPFKKIFNITSIPYKKIKTFSVSHLQPGTAEYSDLTIYINNEEKYSFNILPCDIDIEEIGNKISEFILQ